MNIVFKDLDSNLYSLFDNIEFDQIVDIDVSEFYYSINRRRRFRRRRIDEDVVLMDGLIEFDIVLVNENGLGM